MGDCIFCKIVKGELPCYKIYEDEKVLAILDINPFALGHVLLLPKKHARWVWDLEDSDYLYLMEKVKTIAKVLQKSFNTDWIVEGIAGIDVSHSHVHVIPRQPNDGLGAFPGKFLDPKPTDEQFKGLVKKIKENIS